MPDQELLPEPTNGDDSTFIPNGRCERDDLTNAPAGIRIALQPATPSATSLLAGTADATGVERWATRMAEQHDRIMANMAGVNSAAGALATYASPLARVAETVRAAALPQLTEARKMADTVAASGVSRWASQTAEQHDRIMASMAGVNSIAAALETCASPLARVAETVQAAALSHLTETSVLANTMAAAGIGRWTTQLAQQHGRSHLSGVMGAITDRHWPQAEATQRIRDALQPGLSAASVVAASGVARWAHAMGEQNDRLVANVISANSVSAALTRYGSPLAQAAEAVRAVMQPQRTEASMLIDTVTAAGVGRWATQINDTLSGLSGIGIPDRVLESIRQAGHAARRLRERLYFALLAAREAAMRGDKSAVAAFFEEWAALPRSKPSARMQAAMDALIAAPLEESDPDRALETLEDVYLDAKRRFERGRRPLGETRIRGQEVGSLDADPTKLNDVFSIRCPGSSVEERILFRLDDQVGGQIGDQRLVEVIQGMTLLEQQVIWVYGFVGETWDGAAARLGLPVSEGERIRAKAQRRAAANTKQSFSRPTPRGR